jgi:hypothetical protein
MNFSNRTELEKNQAEILEVLDLFVKGLREKDIEIWRGLFIKEGAHYAFRKKEDGSWVPNYRKPDEWLSILAVETRNLDQLFHNPQIFIRGPIATVWSAYELFRGGERSHSGIDAITLLNIGGAWRIFTYVSTHEPDAFKELLGQ